MDRKKMTQSGLLSFIPCIACDLYTRGTENHSDRASIIVYIG